MKYLCLRTDATTEILAPAQPLGFKDLQKLVGGCLEYIRIAGTHLVAVVHAEGRLTGLPANPFFERGALMGDAVLVFLRPGDEAPRGFPETWIEPLMLWFRPVS